MKLRLSCWAEHLPNPTATLAVVTLLHKQSGVKPSVVLRTEVIRSSNPDWTKSCILNYNLGEDQHLVFSLFDGKSPLGSTLFEVGSIMGSNGVLAKELKHGGLVGARLEEVNDCGQINFQLRGVGLKNLDGLGLGLADKSDPYFELQRARNHHKTGGTVWDAVYRSQTVDNNLNPLFPDCFLDLDILGDRFKLVVYDSDKNGSDDPIGSVDLTVNDLVDKVNDTALQDVANIDTAKAFVLKRGTEETGKIFVVKAERSAVEVVAQGANVAVGAQQEHAEMEDSDYNGIRPTFTNYIAGGCQLRVICAVDSTGSNGNPRDDSSLHFFNDYGLNEYEDAISSICTILSKYDSDQKYPVYGFGAKQKGVVNHCFQFGSAAEVEGVDGILKVYRETFRSGIVMSAPRDFSEVIRTAGENSKKQMDDCQTYSILLLFTNGSPVDSSATLQALKDVEDAPVSIVCVGVGRGDFSGVETLEKINNDAGLRDKVRFVHYHADRDSAALTKAALHHIPSQLEHHFISKAIFPEPESDEVEVLPYTEAADVTVPMVISDNDEVTVTEDVKPPSTSGRAAKFNEIKNKAKESYKKLTKSKEFGKIKRRFKGKAMKQAKGKMNKLLGSKLF